MADVTLNKEVFRSLFRIGEVVNSGGSPDRKNASRLEIRKMNGSAVRVFIVNGKGDDLVSLKYFKIQAVVRDFHKVNPESIKDTIQVILQPLSSAGKVNTSTENYLYGFAREVLQRHLALSTVTEATLTLEDELPDEGGALEGESSHNIFEEGGVTSRSVRSENTIPARSSVQGDTRSYMPRMRLSL